MNKNLAHHWEVASRRQFFQRAGSGLAGIALANMLQQDGLMAAKLADPLAPKKPHHEPKAKSVIWLFMEGGPNHLALFGPHPKPTEQVEVAGSALPEQPNYRLGLRSDGHTS